MGHGVLYCKSGKKKLSVRSSMETELVSTSDCVIYNLWLIIFIGKQGYPINDHILKTIRVWKCTNGGQTVECEQMKEKEDFLKLYTHTSLLIQSNTCCELTLIASRTLVFNTLNFLRLIFQSVSLKDTSFQHCVELPQKVSRRCPISNNLIFVNLLESVVEINNHAAIIVLSKETHSLCLHRFPLLLNYTKFIRIYVVRTRILVYPWYLIIYKPLT